MLVQFRQLSSPSGIGVLEAGTQVESESPTKMFETSPSLPKLDTFEFVFIANNISFFVLN